MLSSRFVSSTSLPRVIHTYLIPTPLCNTKNPKNTSKKNKKNMAASDDSPLPPQPAPPAVDAGLKALFEKIEDEFRATRLGGEGWYLLAAASLVAGPDPELVAQLYLHLCAQPARAASAARQALVRRLREALVKSVALVGVCKPIEAVLALARAERPEDRDPLDTCTRAGWRCGGGDGDEDDDAGRNRERGLAWFRRLYAGDAEATLGLFDAHRDFAWISAEITYGLYLSDRQVLADDVETELVVLPAIMMQNLPAETRWHIRGTRRIGVSRPDVEVVCRCVRLVADHLGVRLHRVPTVEEVEPEV